MLIMFYTHFESFELTVWVGVCPFVMDGWIDKVIDE